MGGDAFGFEAVLDAALDGASPAAPHVRRSCVPGTPDPGLLLSLLGGLSLGLKVCRPDGLVARTAPPRALTAPQRTALDRLRAAGATGLDEAFTRHSLKQAFRQLALRYHPDRHPGCSERDRRRLAASFAGVHDAYRTLLGADARPH